jgi:hypothetical protein
MRLARPVKVSSKLPSPASGRGGGGEGNGRAPVRPPGLVGGGEVQGAFVDGAAGDGAHDALAFHGAEPLHVVQVGDAAAGDDRDGEGLGQLHGGFDVDAGEHAVAADVGVDHPLDAVVLELLRQVDDVVVGHLGPALHRHLAVLGVQADDDVAGKGGAGVVQEAGVLHRRAADDDVGDAVVQVALDGVQVADAAAQLHRDFVAHLVDDGLDGGLVHRLAGEGAVQVHQVQAPGAAGQPLPGHVRRVGGKHRGAVHLALFQADTLAVLQIDRRNDEHGPDYL